MKWDIPLFKGGHLETFNQGGEKGEAKSNKNIRNRTGRIEHKNSVL